MVIRTIVLGTQLQTHLVRSACPPTGDVSNQGLAVELTLSTLDAKRASTVLPLVNDCVHVALLTISDNFTFIYKGKNKTK